MQPAIYNERRILQKPIPIAHFNENEENGDQEDQNHDYDEYPNEDGFVNEPNEQYQNGAHDEIMVNNEADFNDEPEPFIAEPAPEFPAVNEADLEIDIADVSMNIVKEEVMVSDTGLNEIEDILSHRNGLEVYSNAANESIESNSHGNDPENFTIVDVRTSNGIWFEALEVFKIPEVKVEQSLPSSQADPISSVSTACESNESCTASSQVEPIASMVAGNHSASASTIAAANEPDVDPVVHFDDGEISMSYRVSEFPKPIISDPVPSSFVKHENDPISGDKRYEEDKVCKRESLLVQKTPFNFYSIFFVQGARKYYTGQSFVTITKKVVDAMLKWTTFPHCTRKSVDEQVVRLLLVSCIPEHRLQIGQVHETETMFIEGSIYLFTFPSIQAPTHVKIITFLLDLFRIRTKNDEKRFACFRKYVKTYLKLRAVPQ